MLSAFTALLKVPSRASDYRLWITRLCIQQSDWIFSSNLEICFWYHISSLCLPIALDWFDNSLIVLIYFSKITNSWNDIGINGKRVKFPTTLMYNVCLYNIRMRSYSGSNIVKILKTRTWTNPKINLARRGFVAGTIEISTVALGALYGWQLKS